jgi:hypothetical protein
VGAYSISTVLTDFDESSARLAAFLASARLFRRPNGSLIHVRDQEEIAGLTLLKLTLAWESFVEDTFLRYLCGAKSAAGVAPTLLLGKQTKLKVAFRTLSGGNRFLGWQPDTTLKRANKYFDAGEPYETAVKGAKSVLDDMASIRNRIAHRSDHSVIEFQDVVRTHLGFVPKGMTPGRFLLAILPSAGKPAIDHYSAIVSATANLIANHK